MATRVSVSTAIRVAIAVIGLWLALSVTDWRLLVATALGASPLFTFLAVLVIIVIRLVVATRWHLFLRQSNPAITLSRVVNATFVSSSLGTFLPAGLGEDLVRVVYLGTSRGERVGVLASVVLDRLVGMASIGLVGLIGLSATERSGTEMNAVFLASFGIGLLVVPMLLPSAARAMIKYMPPSNPTDVSRLAGSLRRLLTELGRVRVLSRLTAMSMILSVAVQLFRCLTFYLLYISVGSPVSWIDVVTLVPPVLLALMLPVSPGGLGVREAGLAFMFSQVNVPPEASVAVGLLFHAAQLISFLPGFLVLARGRTGSRRT